MSSRLLQIHAVDWMATRRVLHASSRLAALDFSPGQFKQKVRVCWRRRGGTPDGDGGSNYLVN